MDSPSEASAYIAVLLVFLGLSDLTAASLPALPALEYWLGNVPVRLTVLFALTAYSYLCKEGGMLGAATGVGANLCNSWVFSWAFMELMVWYWVSFFFCSSFCGLGGLVGRFGGWFWKDFCWKHWGFVDMNAD
jgi:hypothetical protein